MRFEFVGQSARDADNPAGNPCRLINGYREPMILGGRAAAVMRAVPGMSLFADVNNVFMRAMMPWEDGILTIVNDRLYNIGPDASIVNVGNTEAMDEYTGLDKSTGYAVIVGNREYRHWDGSTLTQVTPGNVSEPASVAVLGGYTLVHGYGTRVFSWSNLADPTTWDGLDFASAEITDEEIIRLVAFRDVLYIFKASGFERWAVTGSAGPNAFRRIGGAQEEPGLAAYGLIVTLPNALSYVGSDGKVHVFGVGPISTPPVEVALKRCGPERMFYYEERGHGFICIAFRDCLAWCYDTATGEWHERAENGLAWTARAAVRQDGVWYVGTDGGKIASLTEQCLDFGAPLVRRYTSRTLDPGRRVRLSKIEAFPRIAGDVQGLGDLSAASVTLRTSRDGIEFGSAKVRTVGPVGAYETRLVWRELGLFRRATIELSQSSATDVPLLAEIDVEAV